MADAISADTSIDAMAPLAALCRMVPDQAFTASMRQEVVAMARKLEQEGKIVLKSEGGDDYVT